MFSANRLKEIRTQQGYSQTFIAKQLEISRVAYHHWENGKTIPNQKNLIALADIFNVEASYFESEYTIVTNYLQLHLNNQKKAEHYVEQLLHQQQSQKTLYPITVLAEVKLSAGLGKGIFDEYETEIVYSPTEQRGYDIAAWIQGDSMSPAYQNGEVALIQANGFDYDGAVYALTWNEAVYIKKLYRGEQGFRMVSLNPNYPEQFIPYEENPQVVGLVVNHFMPVSAS